jgi:anti-sigma factor RsiW
MKPGVPDLSCRELVELVTEYLEGQLPLDERSRFEQHLGECAGCRIYLSQMRQVLETAGELTEESVAPEAKTSLLAAFRDWKRGSGGEPT